LFHGGIRESFPSRLNKSPALPFLNETNSSSKTGTKKASPYESTILPKEARPLVEREGILEEPNSWLDHFDEAEKLSVQESILHSEQIAKTSTLFKTKAGERVFVIETRPMGQTDVSVEIFRANGLLLTKADTQNWGQVKNELAEIGLILRTLSPKGNTALVQVEDVTSVETFEKTKVALSHVDGISRVEKDFVRLPTTGANDPFADSVGSWGQPYADQWALDAMQVKEAWESAVPISEVIVAVIDTGIDFNHPELLGQSWVNENEIPNNDIDDDSNGFIDDYYG